MTNRSTLISGQTAVNGLYQSLLEFGETASNPVLAIMPQADKFKQGQKYPAARLCYPGIGLRAYYHQHAAPFIRDREHGHFHIFLTDEPAKNLKSWQHLAALSVDNMGQPQSWICVNNWVTGGKWLAEKQAESHLLKLFQQETEHLASVEKWIFYMLAVYFSRLLELLVTRDRLIDSLTGPEGYKNLFGDRSVYQLAEIPIDLLADLSRIASS